MDFAVRTDFLILVVMVVTTIRPICPPALVRCLYSNSGTLQISVNIEDYYPIGTDPTLGSNGDRWKSNI